MGLIYSIQYAQRGLPLLPKYAETKTSGMKKGVGFIKSKA